MELSLPRAGRPHPEMPDRRGTHGAAWRWRSTTGDAVGCWLLRFDGAWLAAAAFPVREGTYRVAIGSLRVGVDPWAEGVDHVSPGSTEDFVAESPAMAVAVLDAVVRRVLRSGEWAGDVAALASELEEARQRDAGHVLTRPVPLTEPLGSCLLCGSVLAMGRTYEPCPGILWLTALVGRPVSPVGAG